MKRHSLLLLACGIALAAQKASAQDGLSLLWDDAPGSVPWLGTTGNNERGIAYDPVSGDVIVVSRTGPTIELVNGLTGGGVGTLNLGSGVISGGTFAESTVGVGTDGAIYVANLTTASTTTAFNIYRWSSVSASGPTIVYSGDPGGGTSLRFGDDLRVTGSGTSTRIIAGSGSGTTSTIGVFTTANGTTFSSTKLTISGTGGTDLSKGIAFGPNGTIFGRTTSTSLRQVDATTGALLNSYTLNSISATVGPIAYDAQLGLLAGIEVSSTTGTGQRINLYDVSTFSTTAGNQPIASFLLPTANGNANAVGALEFSPDGTMLFAMDSNNGLLAFTITPEPSTMVLSFVGGFGFAATAIRRRFKK